MTPKQPDLKHCPGVLAPNCREEIILLIAKCLPKSFVWKISTVIGGIIVFFVGIIGASIFFSYNIYAKDQQEKREIIDRRLNLRMGQADANEKKIYEVREMIAEIKSITKRIAEQNAEILLEMYKRKDK